MPLAAPPSISTRNAPPSKLELTGQDCPGCGDGELREMDGWRYCWRCRYAKPQAEAIADGERKASVPEGRQMAKDVEDMLREDRRKGEKPGGSDPTGKPKEAWSEDVRYEQHGICPWADPDPSKTVAKTEARSVVFTSPAGCTAEETRLAIEMLLADA